MEERVWRVRNAATAVVKGRGDVSGFGKPLGTYWNEEWSFLVMESQVSE